MKVETREVDGVTIVTCEGRIKLDDGYEEFCHVLWDLRQKGRKNIILDFEKVGYVDSTVIGELVSTFSRTRDSGGKLVLLKLTRKVQELLDIAKLLTVFYVFDDEQAALDCFKNQT